ncbi:MAG: glycosyltransferase family 4 protein [Stellaceae bacterium]
MRVAFYAPLKPPDHPVPSGDRRLARLFLAALRRAGYAPSVASRLRAYDGIGDARRQAAVAARAEQTAARLMQQWREQPAEAPRLWFTYHHYYKAPDFLGPVVCDGLGIPYVVAEASFAAKRAAGPWALYHHAAEAALRRADAVIGLNPADRAGVLSVLDDPARWVALPPFLDAAAYRPAPRRNIGPARLITVAMMRAGDKFVSYRLLGEALARLGDLAWTLEVIGDGPARAAVAAALAPLGERVAFAGALPEGEIAGRLAGADLFVWPAINVAFGMALLEAQASGLPVVAGASGGVGGIVADNATGLLVPPGDAAAFAEAMRSLIADPARRLTMAKAAWRKVRQEHDLTRAAAALQVLITRLRMAHAA